MLKKLAKREIHSLHEGDFHILIDGYNGFRDLSDPQECYISPEVDLFHKNGFRTTNLPKEKANHYDVERTILNHDLRLKFDQQNPDSFDSNLIADRLRLVISVVGGRRREE